LVHSPLGYPLEPGSEVVPANAAHDERREVFRNLRLVGLEPKPSDVDRLYEICHDMRQPVASIIALAEAALSHAAVPMSVRSRLGQVMEQAEWLGDLLQHLVEQPGGRTEDEKSHDLIRLASEVVQTEMATYTGDLVLQWSEGHMRVLGNWIELRRTIANLLSNATRAAGSDGKVLVELNRAADRILLTVDDSGPGFGMIRRGVGLGLQVVARGLTSYEGDLEYSRSQMGGVRAILVLRVADAAT
jgi:C4-dicarboxylate-specific signal transduction histidine kinase